MRATWNGTVIAESDRTVVVEGNHYFPPESVSWGLLEASGTRSHCPWKGQAHYWSLDGAGNLERDIAWAYPDPSAAARQIAGHLAFGRGVQVAAT